MSTITLVCKGNPSHQRKVPPTLLVDGLPVLQWFTMRGELCAECYERSLARADAPATSKAGASDVVMRSGSQRHRLLSAYADGSQLTADEAMRKAGVNERSCYWKRVSELLHAGLLQDADTERPGEQGSLQRVNRITERGLNALSVLPIPQGVSA